MMPKAQRESALDCIPKEDDGILLPFPFDYTNEQWAKIITALRPLRPTADEVTAIRWRLCMAASSYKRNETLRPSEQKQKKRALKSWRDVKKYAAILSSQLKQLLREDGEFARASIFFEDQSRALFDMIVTASGRIVHLSGKDDGFPDATPKAIYQSVILHEWLDLGGELRFSRHPQTHKIKGPLPSYFSAVTEPVYGGAPESLPDIIKRHARLQAAFEKWVTTEWTLVMMGFSAPTARKALRQLSKKHRHIPNSKCQTQD